VTVYPCGSSRPTASTLNFTPGGVVANAAIAKVGTGGKVCLYTQTASDLIVDVNGFFPAS
jgi:RNA 3'-terminal phosphate cyclase